MNATRIGIATSLAVVLLAAELRPDALVITQAMKATTIAEIFIEPDVVRVELEIGVEDLAGFANLLPDDMREQMGLPVVPASARVLRFFAEDFVVRADGGSPLAGHLVLVEPRRRVERDSVTGEPLPIPEGEGEPVVFAELAYPLDRRPESLTFSPPRTDTGAPAANLGFMAYHRGLPVNDFRYLGFDEIVRLDWGDPWFSKFDNRNLWRQYDSPISAFLYVEHYEVRKEIVIRPLDLQRWVDLGLTGKETITVAEQDEIQRKAVEFLAERSPVLIDGVPVTGELDRVHFIFRNLKTSGVIDPPRDLDVYSATLGVIFYYPVPSLPDEVTMEWDLWDERIDYIPSSSTDEAGALPYRLFREDAVLKWQNFLKNPTIPGLVDIGDPPAIGRTAFLAAGALLLLSCVALVATRGRRALSAKPLVAGAMLVLLAGASLVRGLRPAYLARDEGDAIVLGLLENVYRSFDYRDESAIYDALERSATGELLTDIYLETRRSLELENQGGARAKVQDVTMVDSEYEALGGETGFVSTARWNVTGSVGHWGHVHNRSNQYRARFTVRAVDGLWKISELELLEEERLPG